MSFDNLPAELLLIIYSYISVGNGLSLALAIYPTLRRHNLVPELTADTLIRLANHGQRHLAMTMSMAPLPTAARLPPELWAQIMDYLDASNTLALGFAMGPSFYDINRPLSQAAMDRLRIWSRRARKK